MKVAPPNSKVCSAGGKTFLAPSNFNPVAIESAGRRYGLPGANAMVGQGGTYDFQRVQNSPTDTTFYSRYTPVANLAVGIYLSGAGYSRSSADRISDTFASAFSSNGPTAEQREFRNLAYDIAEGKAKISC